MDCIVSDVAQSHIAAIEALERRCFSLPWTREQLLSQCGDDMHVFLAAISPGGELLGYAGMSHVLDEGYISNVAVAPEHRRRGIAGKLLDEMLARAGELGLSFVTLEVRESNAPAIALYGKRGFIPVGSRKNYYVMPTENAVLMTKYLK